MIKASVVIPSWNGKHLLEICLPSLRKQSFKDFEIIIIENGSTDGSLDYIKKNYPEIKVIALEKNIGFSPAVNLGIEKAQGKYIILINNDTKVDKECIKNLVKCADTHRNVGMIAAKMLNFYKPELIDSAGDYIDVVGHADNIGRGEKDGEKYSKGDYVFLTTGGGSLFKREVFDSVGLFDADYFAYFEDVDLCLRAQMAGFKAYFEPKAKIYHIHKASFNKVKSFTEYLQFRNMTMTVIKDFPNGLLLKDFNWLKIVLVNINTIRFLASIGHLSSALKAEIYIIMNIFNILKKRKKIQSKIKVPVDYIIENIREKQFK